MTKEEIKADCLARLERLRLQIEDGTIECLAYVTAGDSLLWSYSAYPTPRHGVALIAGLEAVKRDMVNRVLPCERANQKMPVAAGPEHETNSP